MHVSPANNQFQPGPEPFNAVDVATLVNVLTDTVINRPVSKSGLSQAIVRPEFIRVLCCPFPHSQRESAARSFSSRQERL